MTDEKQYLDLMRKIMAQGNYREGRNGATYSLFGEQMKFDLRAGFPLLTTKKVFFKGVVVELLWMLRGLTNIDWLHKYGVSIWDEWADENGELGPVYGAQWRGWFRWPRDPYPIDQLKNLIDGIKRDPHGRRHMVSAWNPAEIDQMKLPPCHCFFQCHVANGFLNLHLYQRSADWFLGVPFNIASYALLTHLIARECGLQAGQFVHSFGDLHIYANHRDAIGQQLGNDCFPFPTLQIADDAPGIFDIEPHHITVDGYQSHGTISAPVSK